MATTYYVDGLNGNDGNLGTSFGQAYATIGKAQSVAVNGDTVIICNTATYTLTTTVTWNVVGTAAAGGITVIGGDNAGNPLTATGTPPVITSATNSVALFTLNGAAFHRFKYLKFTHSGSPRGDAFACVTTSPTNIYLEGCVIDGCLNGWNAGSRDANGLWVRDTLIQNCTNCGIININGATAQPSTYVMNSVIYNCTSHGVTTNSGSGLHVFENCIIAKNGGKGWYDTGTVRTVFLSAHNCTIVDNVGDGIRSDENTGAFTLIGQNNIIWGNGGVGVNIVTQTTLNSDTRKLFYNNFYGSNTGGDLVGLSAGVGDVTGITDPFVNRAGLNWGLNNTAGAGALVQAAGAPGLFRGTNTTGYPDGGAVQHSCFF